MLSHHTSPHAASSLPRHDWTREQVSALFALPFPDLMFRAAQVHRENFDPTEVQISTLLSIKTGGCPEDCAYCPQAARYDTGVEAEKLMSLEAVLIEARAAKAAGASRFCMGAAWRSPKDRDLDNVCAMVEGVRALGMETCATLVLAWLTGPVFAQPSRDDDPIIMKEKQKKKDAEDIDRQYKSTLDNTRKETTEPRTDPWQNMRGTATDASKPKR